MEGKLRASSSHVTLISRPTCQERAVQWARVSKPHSLLLATPFLLCPFPELLPAPKRGGRTGSGQTNVTQHDKAQGTRSAPVGPFSLCEGA